MNDYRLVVLSAQSVNKASTEPIISVLFADYLHRIVEQSRKPPTERFTYPQTSSQEYGWISTPLVSNCMYTYNNQEYPHQIIVEFQSE